MVRLQLDDRKWAKIAAVLAERRGAGRRGNDNRMFVEAVLWWRRTGVPWRDLPVDFGPWKTVFNRFDRWSKKGTWTRLFEGLQTDRDDEWHSIDSTINRAHQHAAGGKGGQPSTASVVSPRMAAEPRSLRWTRNCTRRAPRSSVPSVCSSRLAVSLPATRRLTATTLRWSRSGVRCFGCVSDLILAALGQLDQH